MIRLSTWRPLPPATTAQLPSTRSWFSKLLPTTFPIARSVRPLIAATNDVISSGIEVPAETIVSPITASLTPNKEAEVLAPLTRSFDPKVSNNVPRIRLEMALSHPPFADSVFISGSASFIPSGSSLTVLISHTVLITSYVL